MSTIKPASARRGEGGSGSSRAGASRATQRPGGIARRSADGKELAPRKGAKAAGVAPEAKSQPKSSKSRSRDEATTSANIKRRNKSAEGSNDQTGRSAPRKSAKQQEALRKKRAQHKVARDARHAKAHRKNDRAGEKAKAGQQAFRDLITFDVENPQQSFAALKDFRMPRELYVQSRKMRQKAVVTAYAQYVEFTLHTKPDEFAKEIRAATIGTPHPSKDPLLAFLRCVIDYDSAWVNIEEENEQLKERYRVLRNVSRDAAAIRYLAKSNIPPAKALVLSETGNIKLDSWSRTYSGMVAKDKGAANNQRGGEQSMEKPPLGDGVITDGQAETGVYRGRRDATLYGEDRATDDDDYDDDEEDSSSSSGIDEPEEQEDDGDTADELLKLKARLKIYRLPDKWVYQDNEEVRVALVACKKSGSSRKAKYVLRIFTCGLITPDELLPQTHRSLQYVKDAIRRRGTSEPLPNIPKNRR